MIVMYSIGGGILIIVTAFLCHLLYERLLRKLPIAAQQFGKAWGRTTDRYLFLRSLNTFFYITGILVTLTGVSIGLLEMLGPHSPPPPTVVQVHQPEDVLDAQRILSLVNTERKAHKLNELREDTRLDAVAQERLQDMIKNQYYAHLSLDGKYFYDLFPKQQIKADYSCENLDVEFTLDENEYVHDWLTSTKGHKECMLSPDVTTAGYAAGIFNQSDSNKIYLVVAIHASSISKSETSETPTQPATTDSQAQTAQ